MTARLEAASVYATNRLLQLPPLQAGLPVGIVGVVC